MLGYAPDKAAVASDLVEAARDADGSVRNNATRSLGPIAVLANSQPTLGIHIDYTVFLEMLASVTWTDRNKAGFVLMGMTASRSPDLLAALRQRSLPDLIEMARWKSEGHSLSAGLILGRIAGWSEEQTFQAWGKGQREEIISAASAARK